MQFQEKGAMKTYRQRRNKIVENTMDKSVNWTSFLLRIYDCMKSFEVPIEMRPKTKVLIYDSFVEAINAPVFER